MINLVFCLKYSHAYSQVLSWAVLRTLIAVWDKGNLRINPRWCHVRKDVPGDWGTTVRNSCTSEIFEFIFEKVLGLKILSLYAQTKA